MEAKTSVYLGDTSWHLLMDASVIGPKTIYTVGRTLISIFISDTATTLSDTIDYDEFITIGGINGSCDTPGGKFVYARAHHSDGSVFYLPKGQLDPDKDITLLYDTISAVNDDIVNHKSNYENTHRTTKSQVGLDQIPNAVTDTIADTPKGSLVLDAVAIALNGKIGAHIEDDNNPHQVTTAQLGLDKVSNYPIAEQEVDILNTGNDSMYATIKAMHTAISKREQLTSDIAPHTVVSVRSEDLTTAQKALYNPKALSVAVVGTRLQVFAGLQVTYTHLNRTYLSKVITNDIDIPVSDISTTLDKRPGWHYIYVDITTDGTIATAGTTQNRPIFDTSRTNDTSDFFDTVTNQVKNLSGTLIRRVYISKVYVDTDGVISYIVNVPRGNTHVMQISAPIAGNTTYMFNNPYFEDIEVIPEIKLGSTWCNPYWNDQAGVMATYTRSKADKIIVQTGALGVAMIAPSSGNAFTETELNTTQITAVPLRLRIRKV